MDWFTVVSGCIAFAAIMYLHAAKLRYSVGALGWCLLFDAYLSFHQPANADDAVGVWVIVLVSQAVLMCFMIAADVEDIQKKMKSANNVTSPESHAAAGAPALHNKELSHGGEDVNAANNIPSISAH